MRVTPRMNAVAPGWRRFQRARRESGFFGALRRLLRYLNPLQHCLLYRVVVGDPPAGPPQEHIDLTIARYRRWAEITAETQRAILEHSEVIARTELRSSFPPAVHCGSEPSPVPSLAFAGTASRASTKNILFR